MIDKIKGFNQPAPDDVLCQYMPLWAFKSMIENGLHFSYLFSMVDENEGTLSKAAKKTYNDFLKMSPSENVQTIRSIEEFYRHDILINCWTREQEEKMKSWREYVVGGVGILIKTRFKTLQTNLAAFGNPTVSGGIIKYEPKSETLIINPVPKEGGRFLASDIGSVYVKEPDYQWEKEFRLSISKDNRVFQNEVEVVFEETRNGVYLGIHPSILIEEIILSPDMDFETEYDVLSLISQFTSDPTIKRSIFHPNPNLRDITVDTRRPNPHRLAEETVNTANAFEPFIKVGWSFLDEKERSMDPEIQKKINIADGIDVKLLLGIHLSQQYYILRVEHTGTNRWETIHFNDDPLNPEPALAWVSIFERDLRKKHHSNQITDESRAR